MTIIVLNYDDGSIDIIDIPKNIDLDEYLFDTLDYKESQINWMEINIHSITLALEKYFKERRNNE